MTPSSTHREYLLIAGALHVDDIATSHQALIPRASNPVSRQLRLGGVAANAALAAVASSRVDGSNTPVHIFFAACIGSDPVATQLKATLVQAGIVPCLQPMANCLSGRYIAVLDPDGDLYLGLSDVALAESLDPTRVPLQTQDGRCQALLMDANLSEHCLQALSQLARAAGIVQAALSVSPAKSQRLLSIAPSLDILFCNRREAIALAATHFPTDADIDLLADALQNRGFRRFVLTDGSAPVVIHGESGRQYAAVPALAAKSSVNGAGDALAGAAFAAWCAGTELAEAVRTVGLPQARRVLSGSHVAPKLRM